MLQEQPPVQRLARQKILAANAALWVSQASFPGPYVPAVLVREVSTFHLVQVLAEPSGTASTSEVAGLSFSKHPANSVYDAASVRWHDVRSPEAFVSAVIIPIDEGELCPHFPDIV